MNQAVSVTHEGAVSTITFNNPPFNLLDIEVMEALLAAHQEADAHPDTRVMVTRSAIEGMFSNGLNPLVMLELDNAGRIEVFRAVGRLCHGIYGLTKPHIAVVNGPAMAGGAVLAILADFRFFDQDRGRICFAESKVGVPIPGSLQSIIKNVCMPPWLREIVLLGKNFDAATAQQAGLADGLASADTLDAMAGKMVARLSRLSLDVLRVSKEAMRAHVVQELRELADMDPATHPFARFVAPEYLGEGLNAFMEGRAPVFVK
jgi:enoyl-CoA hydratase/carnithine racemase